MIVLPVGADHIPGHGGGVALDPDSFGQILADPTDPNCLATPVQPKIATDNDRILFEEEVAAEPGMAAVLRGYRFNDFGQGQGAEQVYCGCQRVVLHDLSDPDGQILRPGIRVPDDAPSGRYSIELLPREAACTSGGIRESCEAPPALYQPHPDGRAIAHRGGHERAEDKRQQRGQ